MKEQILDIFSKIELGQGVEEINQKFSAWIEQLPGEYQAIAIDVLDKAILTLANFSQQQTKIREEEQKIVIEARLFDQDVMEIHDLQRLSLNQLEYLESKAKSKYKQYALIEGGVAGLGHPLGLLLDFPALLTINLKMVQAMASTYGYSLRYPPEQLLALKVLHAGSLPQAYEEEAWSWLMEELHSQDEFAPFYVGEETIIQREWLQTLAKQWLKTLGLYGLKKISKTKYSLIGALIGAGSNYQFTHQVGSFASRFYRYRFQLEHAEKLANRHEQVMDEGLGF